MAIREADGDIVDVLGCGIGCALIGAALIFWPVNVVVNPTGEGVRNQMLAFSLARGLMGLCLGLALGSGLGEAALVYAGVYSLEGLILAVRATLKG